MFPKLQNITACVVSEITLDFTVIGFIVSSLEQQVSKEMGCSDNFIVSLPLLLHWTSQTSKFTKKIVHSRWVWLAGLSCPVLCSV